MQWNFDKNFMPLTDKIEAGADLVGTITSMDINMNDWRKYWKTFLEAIFHI